MAKLSNIKNLPIALMGVCAVPYNNHIYLFGGIDNNGDEVDTIYEYTPGSDNYATIGFTLPVPMSGIRGVTVGPYIYLFATVGITNKIYTFDLENGVVDTNKTTSIIPDEFCLDREGYNLILLSWGSNYECINLDSDWTISSIAQYTDTESKLGNIKNWIDLHYYYAIKNNKIYMYEMDDTSVGDEVDQITIPTTCGYCRELICYSGYDNVRKASYLLFTKVNGSYNTYYVYRFDSETRELVRQYYLESQFNEYDYFGHCPGTVTDKAYLFGGNYQNDLNVDWAFELDFRYPEIYISYNSTYVKPSNQKHYIERGENYFVNLSQIVINDAYVDVNIDHVYYGGVDIKDDRNKCLIDDRSPLKPSVDVSVKKVYNDLYIEVSYIRYHKVNIIKSEGVTFSNTSKLWKLNNDWISTISLDTDYNVTDFTITDYLGNDIKSSVYDDDTKTITLNRTDWSLYRNVDIKLFAEVTDVILTLYQNTSNERTVDKNITFIKEVTGVLREETSITNPSILIETTGNYILECNYVYIKNLQRYYYIRSIDFVRKNLWRINLHIDVLMSYKDKIKDMRCLISRSSVEFYSRIPNSEVILASSPIIDVDEIPNDIFDATEGLTKCILITTLQ